MELKFTSGSEKVGVLSRGTVTKGTMVNLTLKTLCSSKIIFIFLKYKEKGNTNTTSAS